MHIQYVIIHCCKYMKSSLLSSLFIYPSIQYNTTVKAFCYGFCCANFVLPLLHIWWKDLFEENLLCYMPQIKIMIANIYP